MAAAGFLPHQSIVSHLATEIYDPLKPTATVAVNDVYKRVEVHLPLPSSCRLDEGFAGDSTAPCFNALPSLHQTGCRSCAVGSSVDGCLTSLESCDWGGRCTWRDTRRPREKEMGKATSEQPQTTEKREHPRAVGKSYGDQMRRGKHTTMNFWPEA